MLNTYEEYKKVFGDEVGYLHGKLSDEQKIKILDDFNKGVIKVLVSTTVIEVGIDVKDAEAIVIYGANNFGLAQLHQLRGRVGRNDLQSYCILMSDKPTKRLDILTSTNDGFKISEEDLAKIKSMSVEEGIVFI